MTFEFTQKTTEETSCRERLLCVERGV